MRCLQHVLRYEPGYTAHCEIERRRRQTREWLRQREAYVGERQGSAPHDRGSHEPGSLALVQRPLGLVC